MEDLIGLLLTFGFFFFFIMLGFIGGGISERRHLESLREREEATQGMLVTQLRSFPESEPADTTPKAMFAEVVISSDYLKTILGMIRNLFGGELRSFQALLDRARREALLRLKEQALADGYDAICNVRMETADLAGRGANSKNKMYMASILASATAYRTGRGGHVGMASG